MHGKCIAFRSRLMRIARRWNAHEDGGKRSANGTSDGNIDNRTSPDLELLRPALVAALPRWA